MTQRSEPQPAPTEVVALLESCAADHRGAGATIVVAADAGTACIDAGLARRALDSLIDNAVRHTPASGIITLRAERSGGTLRITVSDTGPGVAADVRANLFEPFVSGRPDGTGLGLAIARELAEAQGGHLTLTDPGGDAPGHGATFTLEVPCLSS